MPWSETSPMEQRLLFVKDHARGLYPMSDLCDRYGISRKTGYKWLARYEAAGPTGLLDRSRRPHHCAHASPPEIVRALVHARRRYPYWGAGKLLEILARRHPSWPWPHRSTACEILERHGLVRRRRRRRKHPRTSRPHAAMTAPNVVWTADFKGEFKTRDGRYCYPLTVVDGCSRYLLGCRALLHPTSAATKAAFVRLFRMYGLPQCIRTDNGEPFASVTLGRLSRLAVWWLQLGILPERIALGHPEQNGRHERLHRTLKEEATRPPAPSCAQQQRHFNRFRRRYNHLRPHESLGQRPPASVYYPSARPLPPRVPLFTYPAHFEVRRVGHGGGIRWRGQYVFVSKALAHEPIGLEAVSDAVWDVFVASLRIGQLHERTLTIEEAPIP